MYESPITTMITEVQDNIAKQFAEQTGNMVYEEIRQVGIHVDKDEMLKALKYDRNQYSKGYADGEAEMREKIDKAIEEILAEIEKLKRDEYSQRQNDYCDGFVFAMGLVIGILVKHIGVNHE